MSSPADSDEPTDLAGVADVSRGELVAALEPAVAAGADPEPSGSTRRALGRELADEVEVLLQRDLVSICTLGWRASAALREAGVESLRRPGQTQLVELAEQSMTCPQTVGFDLFVGAARLATITLTIRCDVSLVDLAVAVADGAITAVEFGACTVTVSIRDAADDVLLERSRPIGDARALRLPARIPLVTAGPD